MFLVNFRFEFGWGDTLINTYNCIGLIKYIKEHTSLPVHFTINNRREANALNVVLDINYFNNLCEEFKILNNKDSLNICEGKTIYQSKEYIRIHTLHNSDINNSIPGGFDVFIEPENLQAVKNLNIPFDKFNYQLTPGTTPNYPIYNSSLYNNAVNFLNVEFESIYYRLTGISGFSGEDRIESFISYLKQLDKTKKYFFCSNSAVIKKRALDESGLDITLFRGLPDHAQDHLPNGYSMFDEDAYFAVSEMLIMGQSKHIHYSGEQSYMSLFNFYPVSVKNVQITDIHKM